MTQEEYTKLKIDDVLFNKKGEVVKLESGWSKNKIFQIEDCLLTENTYNNKPFQIKASECDKWYFATTDSLQENPIAFCNVLKMIIEELYIKLKNL